MDFEKELQELIQAALEAGVSPDTITRALEDGAAAFPVSGEAKSEADEEDDDDEL